MMGTTTRTMIRTRLPEHLIERLSEVGQKLICDARQCWQDHRPEDAEMKDPFVWSKLGTRTAEKGFKQTHVDH